MPHITCIHGLLNKPPKEVLLQIWRDALKEKGLDLDAAGVTSSMVYWADVMYEEPKSEMAAHESNDSVIEAKDQPGGQPNFLYPHKRIVDIAIDLNSRQWAFY